MDTMKPVRILFVCLGNICRSPLAEGVMRELASRNGYGDVVSVD
ncbi:low molecular weight protein-tyrosine-phosphatase YfkJ [Sinorhizobium americanum CCGM7]|nr:low molecular weight protein-tyrosine-phosphatase YfkJ [Sinorhizobium americanum CCGM7]